MICLKLPLSGLKMNSNEMIPVKFPNQNGQQLFGILHIPEKIKYSDTAIIILSPGVKGRVAPHRLYLKMAECFSQLGFMTLRFDFYGLGDSEGEINEEYLADLYCSIQVGRYIKDTLAAVDWLCKEKGINKVILSGLCGGAITGLHAGIKDDRIIALHGLGIPVILDSSNMDKYQFITDGQLSNLRQGYIKKLFDPTSWLRLLTMKSDFKLLIKSILKPVSKKSSVVNGKKQNSNNSKDNFNHYFPKLFHQFAKQNKIMLIFSETDRLYWEFEEKYLNNYNSEYTSISKNVTLEVVSEANHIFTFKEWQQEMLALSEGWLSELIKNHKLGNHSN